MSMKRLNMHTSSGVKLDEHGRAYRQMYAIDHEGRVIPKGRLYEPVADTRQQPKSVAFRMIEERINERR